MFARGWSKHVARDCGARATRFMGIPMKYFSLATASLVLFACQDPAPTALADAAAAPTIDATAPYAHAPDRAGVNVGDAGDASDARDASATFAAKWVGAKPTKPLYEDSKQRFADCGELLAKRYDPTTSNDGAVYQVARNDCMMQQSVTKAKPAAKSFVRNFALDGAALAALPAALLWSPAPGSDAATKDKTVASFAPKAKLAKEREAARISTDDSTYVVVILGYADINGDGVEDVLLRAAGGPTQGTASGIVSLAATRERDGGALRVIKTY